MEGVAHQSVKEQLISIEKDLNDMNSSLDLVKVTASEKMQKLIMNLEGFIELIKLGKYRYEDFSEIGSNQLLVLDHAGLITLDKEGYLIAA